MSGTNPSHIASYPWRGHQKTSSTSQGISITHAASASWNKSSNPDVGRRPTRNVSPTRNSTTTFAPSFIRTVEQLPGAGKIRGYDGEKVPSHETIDPLGGADFSGRRWVWVKDPIVVFVKAEVIDDQDGNLLVRYEDGTVFSTSIAPILRGLAS